MITRVQALLLRLSLHRRILVFISSILLAVFAAFGYVGWTAINQSVDDKLNERMATALVVARHLDDLVALAHMHVTTISADIAARGDLGPQQASQTLEQSLHQVQYFFSYLLVFDPQFRLVASVPEAESMTLDDQSRAVIARALSPGDPGISNLVHLPLEGSYGVLFTAPIVRDGQVAGVLVAEMTVPHPAISSITAALRLGQTGHMEVIDEKGWVLASTSPAGLVDETEHPDYYLPLVKAKRSGVGEALHYENHGGPSPLAGEDPWHVMAFVPLDNASWGVGLGQTKSETFAATTELRNRTIAVAVIALVLALGCVWIGTQSVVGPIRALTRAGERMATGDLSEPIGVVHADEVGRLGQVLEVMRRRLEESVNEIRAWNRELERRVRDRTRDLEVSNRHLQALIALATTASQRADRGALLSKALYELADTLQVASGWIFLWDQKEHRLRLASNYGLPSEVSDRLTTVENPKALCLVALQSLSSQIERDAVCPALPEDCGGLVDGLRCWCTPMSIGAEPFGTLCLAIPPSKKLSNDELALIDGVTHEVAVAFENARLSEERVRLEAQRHLALLRAELLATVSHELRTPLGFIKGYATTLLREDVTWEQSQQREFLTIIDEECDRLSELVDSLLDAARSQAGRLNLRLSPISLQQVLRRSVERMAGPLANHRVALTLDVSTTVLADESRLEQVVVNLLQNAAKYTPKGGTIEIRVDMVADEARVAVLDEGVGVPPDEIGHIFEPFYRASTAGAAGAGLGLAISRAIIEAHGGRIWAEPRVERGTSVNFTLRCCGSDGRGKAHGQEARAGS